MLHKWVYMVFIKKVKFKIVHTVLNGNVRANVVLIKKVLMTEWKVEFNITFHSFE